LRLSSCSCCAVRDSVQTEEESTRTKSSHYHAPDTGKPRFADA
jgi:hypothetical protein